MSNPPARNTDKAGESRRNSAGRNRPGRPAGKGSDKGPDEGWIWGRHAVLAALENPRREPLALHVTRNAARDLPDGVDHMVSEPKAIDRLLPDGAVHQGFALKTRALKGETLNAVADPTHGLVLVLDQITDPHNVGAIFRSAAALGARAIVMQDRKSPPLFGTVCKSAVGAVERLSHIRVTNISEALIHMRDKGRFVIGLAGESETTLADALAGPDGQGHGAGAVLVLGSEDKGLRPRVAENCDLLARIEMTGAVESLNVSNAAAIALYEAQKRRPRRSGDAS